MTLAQFDRLDEDERALWLADHELEQEHCAQHGGPRVECCDPERLWYPQRSVCYAAMEAAAANARYEDLYGGKFHDGSFKNWSEKRSPEFPYAARDGVSIWVAPEDLSPDDDFLS